MLNTTSNKIWLVKSATRILGPYSTEEIIHELETQHISIIDEICTPQGRWCYLREVREFYDVIKRLRERQSFAREDTQTSTLTSQTITQTEPISHNQDDTPTPPLADMLGSPTGLKDVSTTDISSQAYKNNKVKKFSVHDEKKIKAEVKTKLGFAWIFIILIFTSGLLYIYWKKHNPPVVKVSEIDVLLPAAQAAKQVGLYTKALDLYKKAYSLTPENVDVFLPMSNLMIYLEKQTITTRRLLEESLRKSQALPFSAEIYNLIGLSYLVDGDYTAADLQLQKSLSTRAQYIPAIMNRALVFNQKNNFQEALELFSKAEESGVDDGLSILGQAIVVLNLSKADPNWQLIEQASRSLDLYIDKHSDYKQEALLLKLALETRFKESKNIQPLLLKLMEQDPDSTENHVHDISMDRKILSWSSLLNFCHDIYERIEASAFKEMFMGYCLVKSGRETEARPYINEAIGQAPKDTQLKLIHAYILRILGKEQEARASLKLALKNENLMSALLLKANFCEIDNNLDCASESWQTVLKENPNSIAAISGTAWLKWRRGELELAREWMQKGLALTTNYQPLLELRDQLSKIKGRQ